MCGEFKTDNPLISFWDELLRDAKIWNRDQHNSIVKWATLDEHREDVRAFTLLHRVIGGDLVESCWLNIRDLVKGWEVGGETDVVYSFSAAESAIDRERE